MNLWQCKEFWLTSRLVFFISSPDYFSIGFEIGNKAFSIDLGYFHITLL